MFEIIYTREQELEEPLVLLKDDFTREHQQTVLHTLTGNKSFLEVDAGRLQMFKNYTLNFCLSLV